MIPLNGLDTQIKNESFSAEKHKNERIDVGVKSYNCQPSKHNMSNILESYGLPDQYPLRSPLQQRDTFLPRHVLPHFIVIGEAKCGTSTFIKMLNTIYPNVKALTHESGFFVNNTFLDLEWYKQSLPPMTNPNDLIAEKNSRIFQKSIGRRKNSPAQPRL